MTAGKKTSLHQSASADDVKKRNTDEKISLLAQTIIETRLNAAIADLRENNHRDARQLSREYANKWKYLAIVTSVITLFTFFFAPQQIVEWIGKGIDHKLTEPMLQKSADELLKTKMATYVSDKLIPLTDQAQELSSQIGQMETGIANKQKDIEEEQSKLAEQLKIHELSVAAKAGSREAWVNLKKLQIDDTSAKNLQSASIKEVEFFYYADRYAPVYRVAVNHNTTRRDVGSSTEELMSELRYAGDDTAEAIINTLARRKNAANVSTLVEKLNSTKSLRVAARITRALSEITGEGFEALDFERVDQWWESNETNAAYCGDYSGYFSACPLNLLSGYTPKKDALIALIAGLDRTIATDPQAWHARCLKAGFLLILDRDDEARALLNEIGKSKNDYYWYLAWDAAAKIKAGETDAAINQINQALLQESSIFFALVDWDIFKPVRNNPNIKIKWPKY
ncbi:MAG: hypothetical protein WC334_09565 [Kiritimatiellales bacterium]